MSSDLAKLPPSGLSSAKEPPTTSTLKDVANQQESSSSPVATKKAAATTISKPAVTVVTPNTAKTPTVPRTLLDNFIKWGDTVDPFVCPKDAKKDYFLTTDEIRFVDCERIGGGIGCGPPMRCYQHRDLIKVCLEKYGLEELRKKLEARSKRNANKRAREEKAEQALEQAQKKLKSSTTTSDASVPAAAAKDTAEVKTLRASLLKIAKKGMGFDMSGSPKNWRIEVPGMTAGMFAALMDRPTDVDLATFVKKGAYYTEEKHDANDFFGISKPTQLWKTFRREGVTQQIGSGITVRFKPSCNELSVNLWAEITDPC